MSIIRRQSLEVIFQVTLSFLDGLSEYRVRKHKDRLIVERYLRRVGIWKEVKGVVRQHVLVLAAKEKLHV